jgi:hypothetical protein
MPEAVRMSFADCSAAADEHVDHNRRTVAPRICLIRVSQI